MPLIEELPTNAPLKASHGWAYVPDHGPIAAVQPGSRNDRKRAAATTAAAQVNHRSRQEKAIQARLDSLNKENYKDGLNIPIPPRPAGLGDRNKGRKMTSNVKRILTYQRGFQHYLAEELSNPEQKHYMLPNIATGGMAPPMLKAAETSQGQVQRDSKDPRRRSGVNRQSTGNTATLMEGPQSQGQTTPPTKRRGPSSRSRLTKTAIDPPCENPELEAQVKQEEDSHGQTAQLDQDTVMTDTSTPPQPSTYPPEYDNDPLLRTLPSEVPLPPSDRVMQLLVSEPPLTWTAARATPLNEDIRPPPRHFCGICGYWGRVKCKKCGAWTCGIMECWRGHESVCAMANVF